MKISYNYPQMKNLLRNILPQWTINYCWHLPKAILANILYGFPGRELKAVGVTGTDGKTTTVNMIYQILKDAKRKVSMVSTINSPGLHVTSPDPFTVQKLLREAVQKGSEYIILEVTSHAIDQFRFWGIKFDVGVITNITHEHLDYHKSFKNYVNVKLKLLKMARIAVANQNLNIPNALTFNKKLKLKLKIPGDYNMENALAAMAVANVLGVDQQIARKSIENFQGLPGRMEEVKNSRGIKIIIDFAHTPNGLENVLTTLKSQTKGRLISLIGCEGKRDISKRRMMGEIAQKIADEVIVTAVDPRGQLEAINRQIIKGAKKNGAKEGQNLFVIDDRKSAIEFAIRHLAKKGDLVGIFGKGHERSMNLDGKREIPWSDKETVWEILHG